MTGLDEIAGVLLTAKKFYNIHTWRENCFCRQSFQKKSFFHGKQERKKRKMYRTF
jgi:hypothetical protein